MPLIKIATHDGLGEDYVNPDAVQTLRWYYRNKLKVDRFDRLTDEFDCWEFWFEFHIGGVRYDLSGPKAVEAYEAFFDKPAPPPPESPEHPRGPTVS